MSKCALFTASVSSTWEMLFNLSKHFVSALHDLYLQYIRTIPSQLTMLYSLYTFQKGIWYRTNFYFIPMILYNLPSYEISRCTQSLTVETLISNANTLLLLHLVCWLTECFIYLIESSGTNTPICIMALKDLQQKL